MLFAALAASCAMKLCVDRLTETPTSERYEVGAAWWHAHAAPGKGLPEAPSEPFRVEVQASKHGEDVHLEGQLTGAFQLECGRCLARYRQPLRESFRLVLEPAGTREPGDPEAAQALARDGLCFSDELEVGWYRGVEVQLDSVCLELITLALPVQPLCREDCAGLCPRCGADRNTSPCGCAEQRAESPFAALAALRVTRGER
jgi:uncharacterized metal-binding protein YceD (DUF177 family)